jgi:hypothetical protein
MALKWSVEDPNMNGVLDRRDGRIGGRLVVGGWGSLAAGLPLPYRPAQSDTARFAGLRIGPDTHRRSGSDTDRVSRG